PSCDFAGEPIILATWISPEQEGFFVRSPLFIALMLATTSCVAQTPTPAKISVDSPEIAPTSRPVSMASDITETSSLTADVAQPPAISAGQCWVYAPV